MNRLLQGLLLVAGVTLLLGAFPNSSYALGSYKFCAKWRYQWTDEPGNQDYLGHAPGSTGTQVAAFATYNLLRNGTLAALGSTDSAGCFTTVPGNAGTYTVRLFPQIKSGSKTFSVFSKTDKQWEVMEWTATLDAVPTGIILTQTATVGSTTGVANVAAVASNVMLRASAMGVKDWNYIAYVDENCPPNPKYPDDPLISACGLFDALYLGTHNGARRVFTKHVVGHELGHLIGFHLDGNPSPTPMVAYGADGCTAGYHAPDTCDLPPECQCLPFVMSSNAVHCLQSREFARDAAQEGWGHFYATALFNSGSNPGSFTYYKEFYTYGGVINPPALNYEVTTAPLIWMETYCIWDPNTENRGVEADWQWFFYNLHRLSGANNYSMDDIAKVYAKSAHLGASTWAELVTSAAKQFPGAKGALWRSAGFKYGVRR